MFSHFSCSTAQASRKLLRTLRTISAGLRRLAATLTFVRQVGIVPQNNAPIANHLDNELHRYFGCLNQFGHGGAPVISKVLSHGLKHVLLFSYAGWANISANPIEHAPTSLTIGNRHCHPSSQIHLQQSWWSCFQSIVNDSSTRVPA